MEFLPITTPRLLLRRFTTEDLGAFQAYRSEPGLGRFQGWEATSDDRAREFLSEQARRVFGQPQMWLQMAVTRLDSCELIGDLALRLADPSGVLEVGYTLAGRAQGYGFATEAVAAVLDALLSRGLVRSVRAATDSRNLKSIAVLQRLGFRLIQAQNMEFRGECCEEQTYALTEEQCEARRAALRVNH